MKAFPMTHPSDDCRFIDSGMDLRDYFASRAMQAILTGSWNVTNPDEVTKKSYEYADAMLKGREL